MSAQKCVIESIDGMGKSTTAQATAQALSEAYPQRRITVVDSTGIYRYAEGTLVNHALANLESLEPHQATSKIAIAARLGMFTLARKAAEGFAARNSDLLIAVRDPYRADPATYARIFGPEVVQGLSSECRLRFFDALTLARHPDLIIHLHSESKVPQPVIGMNSQLDSHETPDKLQVIAEELPRVLRAYGKLYDIRMANIEALQATTTDETIAQVEQLLVPNASSVYFSAA